MSVLKGVMAVSALLSLAACTSSGGGNTDEVQADHYVFASKGSITVQKNAGILSNDGSDFTSVSLQTSVASSSELILNSDGSFTYTPGADVGSDSFTYLATNGSGLSKVGSVTIEVVETKTACTAFNATQASSAILNSAYSPDDGLVFSLVNGPKLGSVTNVDLSTGGFNYNHNGTGRGVDKITYQVTDQYGGQANVDFHVVSNPVRIMPLGDSITQGVESDSVATPTDPRLDSPKMENRVGYRKPLYDLLNASGLAFDFVGSQSDAGYNVLNDFQHEGHPGYTDAEISGEEDPNGSNSSEFNKNTDGVYKWLDKNSADVILLHAGTNNIKNRQSSFYIERILDEVNRWESNNNTSIAVIVAKIIDKKRGSEDTGNVKAFNQAVESLVNARIANGENLSLVDMFTEVPASLLNAYDQTHLTPAGYSKMAQAWKESIDDNKVLLKCP